MTKKSCLKGDFRPISIEKQRFETAKVTIQNHKSGRFQQRNRPLLYYIGINKATSFRPFRHRQALPELQAQEYQRWHTQW